MRYPKRVQSFAIGLLSAGVLTSGAAWAASRTWTDSTGKHTIKAELVEATTEHVVLKKSDGATKRIPLDKLSAADQEFVAEHLAAKSADAPQKLDQAKVKKPYATGDVADDRIAARKTAKDFFDKLRDEDRNVVGDLLTAAAQERLAAGSSPVTTLPKPDSARSVRVGKATIDEDQATVTAKLRAGGSSQDVKVFLRREEGAWKVRAVSAAIPGGEEQILEFEEGSDATIASEGLGEPREVPPRINEFTPPDGEAEQLIAFINQLQKDPRFAQDRDFRARALEATLDASDKVFDLEGSTKQQLTTVGKHKLQALAALIGSERKDLKKRAESLAKQVKKHRLDALVRPVEALQARLELPTSPPPADISAAPGKVDSIPLPAANQ